MPGPEQPLDGALAFRPTPPAALALVIVGELAGGLRTLGLDLAAHRLDQVGALAAELGEAGVDPLPRRARSMRQRNNGCRATGR